MKKCSNCGVDLALDQERCHECGTVQDLPIFKNIKEDAPKTPEQVAAKPELEKEMPAAVGPEEVPEPKVPGEEFYDNIFSHSKVTIDGQWKAPVSGHPTTISGKITLEGFVPFTWEAEAQKVGGEGATILVRLVVDPTGLVSAMSNATDLYRKQIGTPFFKRFIPRMEEAALEALFERVIILIDNKKPDGIVWSAGREPEKKLEPFEIKSYEGSEPFRIIQEQPGAKMDPNTGKPTPQSWPSYKSIVNSIAGRVVTWAKENLLKRDRKVPSKEDPRLKYHSTIKLWILNLPEDLFTFDPKRGSAYVIMPWDKVPANIKTAIEGQALVQKDGTKVYKDSDFSSFWYEYNPDKKEVSIENMILSYNGVLKEFQQISSKFGGASKEEIYRNLANEFEMKLEKVPGMVTDWVKKAKEGAGNKWGDVRNFISDILFPKAPLKKVAYGSEWAGPSLDQTSKLVGGPVAQWASELAGTLAGRFDHVGFPSLVGSPTELKKVAILSPTQKKLVEKYRKQAISFMEKILSANNVKVDKEESNRLAEDGLLQVADSSLSSISEEEFLTNLKKTLTEMSSNFSPVEENPEDYSGKYSEEPLDINKTAFTRPKCSKCGQEEDSEVIVVGQGEKAICNKCLTKTTYEQLEKLRG